ncbi:hypothetical protein ACLKA7_001969 [Drosophila subpalustris]
MKLLVAPVSMVACLTWPSIWTCATMRAFSTRMIVSIAGTGWWPSSPGSRSQATALRCLDAPLAAEPAIIELPVATVSSLVTNFATASTGPLHVDGWC